jgi:hypothetical protein
MSSRDTHPEEAMGDRHLERQHLESWKETKLERTFQRRSKGFESGGCIR